MLEFPNQGFRSPDEIPVKESESTGYAANWLQKLENFTVKNLGNADLTNVELAAEMQVSERTLYTKVKDLTGESPNHYIRNLRMSAAKDLLESGDFQTVSEVAYAVGFLNVEYFSVLFKKQHDVNPSQILRGKKVTD